MSYERMILYYYGQLCLIDDNADEEKRIKQLLRINKKKSGEEKAPELARDLARADDDGFANVFPHRLRWRSMENKDKLRELKIQDALE